MRMVHGGQCQCRVRSRQRQAVCAVLLTRLSFLPMFTNTLALTDCSCLPDSQATTCKITPPTHRELLSITAPVHTYYTVLHSLAHTLKTSRANQLTWPSSWAISGSSTTCTTVARSNKSQPAIPIPRVQLLSQRRCWIPLKPPQVVPSAVATPPPVRQPSTQLIRSCLTAVIST